MFDPYHDWLSISKVQRPPSLYALLGISSSERDPEAISDACMLRILQISQHKKGPHAQLYAKIVKEIQEARDILSNPAKREQYENNPKGYLHQSNSTKAASEDEGSDVEPLDLADESTRATNDPSAWWDDAPVEPAQPKAKKVDWWKQEIPVSPGHVSATPLPAATPPASPVKPSLVVAAGFDEFTMKKRKSPRKQGGALKWVFGILLLAGGGGAAYYFTQIAGKGVEETKVATQLEKKDSEKEVLTPKSGITPPVKTDAASDIAKPVEVPPKEIKKEDPKGLLANTVKKPVFQSGILKGHQEAVRFSVLRKDGSALVTTGDDQLVLLHRPDFTDAKKLVKLESPARGLLMFPSGKSIAVTDGGTIFVIQLESGDTTQRLVNLRGGVRALAISSDEQILFTGNTAGDVDFWKLGNKEPIKSVNLASTGAVTSLAVTPDDSILAVGMSDGSIQRIDAKTYKKLNKWKGSAKGKSITQLAFSHDGGKLISLGDDNELTVWNPVSDQKLESLSGGKDTLTAFRQMPSDKSLLACSLERGLISTTYPLKKFDGTPTTLEAKPYSLDSTSSGDLVAVALSEGKTQIVRLQAAEAGDVPPVGNLEMALLPPQPLPVPDFNTLKSLWQEFKQKEAALLDSEKTEVITSSGDRFAKLAESVAQAPESRFIYFTAARKQYVKLLDFDKAFKVVASHSRWFQIDSFEEWTNILEEIAKNIPNGLLPPFTVRCMSFLDEAEKAQRYDCIVRLLPVVERLAKFSTAEEVVNSIEKLKGRLKSNLLEEGQAVEARKKLESNSNDASSHAILGKYLLLRKRNYAEALSHLSQGDMESLKKLASQDLKNPTEFRDQIELGNAWWALGISPEVANDSAKASCWLRAKHWYLKALESGQVGAADKIELLSKNTQATELARRLDANSTKNAPKTPATTTTTPATATETNLVRSNAQLIGNEKNFSANLTNSGGSRLETDGVRFTKNDAAITTRFLVEDSWRIHITAIPGAAGLRIQVLGEEIAFPGTAPKSSIVYTLDRKGTKLSYSCQGSVNKSAIPSSGTILLQADKSPPTPIVIQPGGNIAPEGILLKSITFSGTIKPMPKE
ncbi:hypothetical protein KIH39_10940 [Telmatocola sphagniphila]|uniref:J domain-containing protein n=1 Tax=Telmatocola sphagniphila TaxID=1123043 RepID=A0A8E6B9J9_9BACT|nr:hypothetical protein [Telmatocola sphagniphila]QVL34392.1 hypothetical protein KIH39_10940 [Telmatocola sphagniphila]